MVPFNICIQEVYNMSPRKSYNIDLQMLHLEPITVEPKYSMLI